MDVERLLNSVGKEIFVNYFYEFKNCTNEGVLAQKLLNENPKASALSGQITRINCAKRIISDENALKQALNLILISKRLSYGIIKKAKEIKKAEFST